MNALLRLFALAETLVDKELARVLARDSGGASTARHRNQRLTEIRAILAELQAKAVGTDAAPGLAWDVVKEGYLKGSREAVRGAQDAVSGDVSTSLGGIHLQAARALYASLVDDLSQAILYAEKTANRTFRKVALQEVLVGQLSQRRERDTGRAVEENLKSRGVDAFVDRRGRRWSLSDYASMAAQTVAVEAQSTAVLTRLSENGIDLCRWNTRPSVGNREPCEPCKKRDGKVYSITGATGGYELLDEAPPLHPRCGCLLTAYVELANVV